MKHILILIILISLSVNSQELYIQSFDKLKGSDKVTGLNYTKGYDNTSHIYRYFDEAGKEIFLIKSFNEKNEEINLSIEKNKINQSIEIIINNKPVATVFNSIIYDLNMNEIGRLFDGRYSKKNINDFWEGVDFRYGNISIYDYEGNHKLGSFFMKEKIDYYGVLGVQSISSIDQMDSRQIKRKVRDIQRVYKKLLKSFNLKRNPDDKELAVKVNLITTAYNEILNDLGYSKEKEKKILGLIPSSYLEEQRRTNWSEEEGYVPYTKRKREDHKPDTGIQKNELFPNK